MKKIVAIIAVSLMLLASCGKTKDLGSPGLKKDGEGSGTIGSNLATPVPTPSEAGLIAILVCSTLCVCTGVCCPCGCYGILYALRRMT
jgi:hypothetical protein